MDEQFDFISGWLCLDFTNERKKIQRDDPGDYYRTLVRWGVQAGLIGEKLARRLGRSAARKKHEVEVVVGRARRLGETLQRVFTAELSESRPARADVAVINQELTRSLGNLSLIGSRDGFRLGWPEDHGDVDRILWPVAQSAADLLVSDDLARLKICDAETCAYMFVDGSKGGRRRWCDMRVCGNRSKARRFRDKVGKAIA